MGTKKPMLRERSDVEHLLWRKKVDKSLFGHNSHGGTTIPRWMWSGWLLEESFGTCTSERDPQSEVTILFEGKQCTGHVTMAKQGRETTPICRLWLPDELCAELRFAFPMSYMRALERELTSDNKRDVEKEIPFWEFLDVEYDPQEREFKLTAHYVQGALFPLLFERLIRSGLVDGIVGGGNSG